MVDKFDNPWVRDGHLAVAGTMELGEMDRVLALAQSTGHMTPGERTRCFERFTAPLNDSKAGSNVDRRVLPSDNELINTPFKSQSRIVAMNKISGLFDTVNHKRMLLNEQSLNHRYADLTTTESLKAKLAVLEELSTHLGEIQSGFSLIEQRYSNEYFDKEHIELEASFHSTLVDLLSLVGTSLSQITNQCKKIEDVSRDLNQESLSSYETKITSLPNLRQP